MQSWRCIPQKPRWKTFVRTARKRAVDAGIPDHRDSSRAYEQARMQAEADEAWPKSN